VLLFIFPVQIYSSRRLQDGSVPFDHVNIDHSPDWLRCNWPRYDW